MDDRPYLTLSNPITVDRVSMRHSQLASVLEILTANSRFEDRVNIFELGKIFLAGEEGILPDELHRLPLVMTGPKRNQHWSGTDSSESIDFFDMKGVIEELAAGLYIEDLVMEPGNHASFQPGRTARVLLGKQQIGWLGQVHPMVIDAYGIRGGWSVIAADLDLDAILAHVQDAHQVEPVPVYPAVHEDIALILDRSIPAAEVGEIIKLAGGTLLREAELFDVYEGRSIPNGKKSLAYHLTFQSPGKTLTDKVVRKNRDRIVKQLAQKLGAQLRDA
jgi:phenylalanyl-tRNA synthetase beta chain